MRSVIGLEEPTAGRILAGIDVVFDRAAAIIVFFFNDTATTEIYTLSLHDALPICSAANILGTALHRATASRPDVPPRSEEHTSELQSRVDISYAVFCLKKKTT